MSWSQVLSTNVDIVDDAIDANKECKSGKSHGLKSFPFVDVFFLSCALHMSRGLEHTCIPNMRQAHGRSRQARGMIEPHYLR